MHVQLNHRLTGSITSMRRGIPDIQPEVLTFPVWNALEGSCVDCRSALRSICRSKGHPVDESDPKCGEMFGQAQDRSLVNVVDVLDVVVLAQAANGKDFHDVFQSCAHVRA